MRPVRMLMLVGIGAAVLTGCATVSAGSTQPGAVATGAAPAPGDQTGAVSTQASLAAPPPGGGVDGGRDISSLDVCALLKQEDVAGALLAQIARPADRTDMGTTTHGCTYYFGPQNSTTYDSYIVYVEAPSVTDAQIQVLTPEEKSHPVSGVGDVAYLITELDGTQYRLEFLRKGDAGVEVIGPKADWVQKIGELIAARLGQ